MSDDPDLVSPVQRATTLLEEIARALKQCDPADAANCAAMADQILRDLLRLVADQAQTIERLRECNSTHAEEILDFRARADAAEHAATATALREELDGLM